MREGAVPQHPGRQQGEDGHWEESDRFYTAKYRGTVWQLIILAELGADGADERVRAACEAVLRDAQDPDSGGFAHERSKKAGGGLHGSVIPCLTGNLAFSLIRLGMLDDPRVQRALDWITTYQRFDDAEGEAPAGWPYDRYEMCWGRHTCHMGAVKALKALAEVPPERRTPAAEATIAAGAEFMLRHHVHKRSHDLGKDLQARLAPLRLPAACTRRTCSRSCSSSRGWASATSACAKRSTSSPPRPTPKAAGSSRTPSTTASSWPIEAKGEPSRWVTLRALEVLQAAPS